MIASFEFKVTVHYGLWDKSIQLWPLKEHLTKKILKTITFPPTYLKFGVSYNREEKGKASKADSEELFLCIIYSRFGGSKWTVYLLYCGLNYRGVKMLTTERNIQQ